jgi:hypothetical protein
MCPYSKERDAAFATLMSDLRDSSTKTNLCDAGTDNTIKLMSRELLSVMFRLVNVIKLELDETESKMSLNGKRT